MVGLIGATHKYYKDLGYTYSAKKVGSATTHQWHKEKAVFAITHDEATPDIYHWGYGKMIPKNKKVKYHLTGNDKLPPIPSDRVGGRGQKRR